MKIKKTISTLLFVAVFILNSLDCVSIAEELKLCGVQWPPFTYSETGKIVKGISFEVYTEAFHRLNIKFKAQELPWPRCLKYVKEGKYDAVIDNAALKPFLYGKYPTGVYSLAMYVRHGFPQEKFLWEDIKGKKVGMVRGYDYTEKIVQFEGWKPDFAITDEMMLRKLQRNRYDYAICDIFAAPILADKLGIKIKMLTPLIDSTKLYLVFNKTHAEIVKKYDRAIGEMIKDGTMDMIFKKYFPYSYNEIMDMSNQNK